MSYIEYVATESIMVGHVASVTYGMACQLTKADRRVETLKSSQRSLSGRRETLYFGKIATWDITFFPVPNEEADWIREFLDSTADGQVFTLDPYGTRDSPVMAMAVTREDAGYTERRVTLTGSPATLDHIEFGFSVSVNS